MTEKVPRTSAAGRLSTRPAAVASGVGLVLIGVLQALRGPAVPGLCAQSGLSPSAAGLGFSLHRTGGVAVVLAHRALPRAWRSPLHGARRSARGRAGVRVTAAPVIGGVTAPPPPGVGAEASGIQAVPWLLTVLSAASLLVTVRLIRPIRPTRRNIK